MPSTGCVMAIGAVFDDVSTKVLGDAFDAVLAMLHGAQYPDRVREAIADRVLEFARNTTGATSSWQALWSRALGSNCAREAERSRLILEKKLKPACPMPRPAPAKPRLRLIPKSARIFFVSSRTGCTCRAVMKPRN